MQMCVWIQDNLKNERRLFLKINFYDINIGC
jgi:hypothetical protein